MSWKYNSSVQQIYQNDRVEVSKDDKYLEIKYLNPHIIKIAIDDKMAIDNEVIRMIKMRDEAGGKYFVQKEIGKVIGVSRQMINRRWQVYKEEGLIPLLLGEWEHSKITPELLDRLAEISVENPFLTPKEIIEIFKSEKLCEEMSETTIYNGQRMLDGRKLIELIRKKMNKKMPDSFMEGGYIIEKLFEIIESLFEKVKSTTESINDVIHEKSLYQYLKNHYRAVNITGRTPTKKDQYIPRKKLERDRKRNIGFIRRLLAGIGLLEICPDCHNPDIKFKFRRARKYVNKTGEKIEDYSLVYQCLNKCCLTKFFTIPPKGVELYARVHKEVKKMVLRWIFHLRGSLKRVCDELLENGIKVALTTILRWIKKAGEESVEMMKIINQDYMTQPICIDEKWIKVRGKWCYAFTAVGVVMGDLLAVELYYHKGEEEMKAFLLYLKSLGYNPRIIVTDLLMWYEKVVKEVFPDCYYHQCVLHAERDAKRIVRKNLPDGIADEWKKKLVKSIRKIFASKNAKQAKKRYRKFLRLKEEAPEEVLGVFKMMSNYYPKLFQSFVRKDIPKTTNPVERAIGEFEEKYQNMKGFTSFHYARWFLKAFQVYYRLRKISFGSFKGKNRLELKGNPIGKLKFADYLVPTFY